MDCIISGSTDIGISKETNQDSYYSVVLKYKQEKVVFAIICDGMGGLSNGDLASATLVNAFKKWVNQRLPIILNSQITYEAIKNEWTNIVIEYNKKIKEYGRSRAISLGTTVVAILLYQDKYYVINVGDSRLYEINSSITVLTTDQTVVAREVQQGRLTPAQAETDPRRSVLLQCVGASEVVYPEILNGYIKKDTVYMLCSDGFRHEISLEEIYNFLNPAKMNNNDEMKANIDYLIDINKKRNEKDNITVVAIRTI